MEQIKLKATVREEKGKQAVNRLRRSGFVPAIVYHRGDEPVSISIVDKEITKILQSAGGENVLINLTIEKEKKAKPRSVIVKEVQQDPVKRNILHVDFNEISLTEKIQVEVEVVGVGESAGVKLEGGTLDHPLRQVKIECLPTDIPKHIEVDVTGLKLNDSIHVSDLKLSDKIRVLNEPDVLLFQVKLREEKKEEEVPAEAPEIEVIREKKEEEGAAPAKAEAKAKEAPKPEKK
ncbi:MAG: 50S ribosomal protein L25 [Candidatus Omnitrophota bacterium]